MAKSLETGTEMREVPADEWPIVVGFECIPLGVWVDNEFLAVLYEQRADGSRRLTVNRRRRNGKDWRDGITWDDLQRIKNECLGPETWCIESYPSESALVNVSNQRHLFVLNEPPTHKFPTESAVSDGEIRMALELIKGMIRR